MRFSSEFLVRLERLAVRARRSASGVTFGRGKGARAAAGGGLEFVDVREYSPGDDLRAVDWNLYARFDKLLLRVYRQEREHDVHVLLDVSQSMAEPDRDKFERAREVAAAVAYVGLSRLDRVAVWPIADGQRAHASTLRPPFPLTAGKRRAGSLFAYLNELQPGGNTDLAAACRVFARMARSRGVVVLISDFYDLGDGERTGSRAAIRLLISAGFDVHGVQIVGASDHAPGAKGRLALVDVETGRSVRGRVGEELQARVSELAQSHQHALGKLLRAAGGSFVAAGHARSLEDILLRDLRRYGVLE